MRPLAESHDHRVLAKEDERGRLWLRVDRRWVRISRRYVETVRKALDAYEHGIDSEPGDAEPVARAAFAVLPPGVPRGRVRP